MLQEVLEDDDFLDGQVWGKMALVVVVGSDTILTF
jgi:hypothetical protein